MMKRLTMLATTVALATITSAAVAQALRAPTYFPAASPLIELGVPVHGSLTEDDGQNFKDGTRVDVLTFRASAGDELLLSVGSEDFDTYVTAYDPNGELIGWNDDDWYGSSNAYYQSALELYPEIDGRYTVIISSYSTYNGLGDYTVLLEDISVPTVSHDLGNAPAIAVPSSKVLELTPDMPVTGEGFNGPSQVLAFTLDEELLVRISASSETVDTVLLILDADGQPIATNDDYYDPYTESSAYWRAEITTTLGAGDYYIVAGSYSAYDAGEFQLDVAAYRPLP